MNTPVTIGVLGNDSDSDGDALTVSHVSDPAHGAGTRSGAGFAAQKNKPLEATISGNTVSLDQELMKAADTAMDYQLVTNLYRKQLGMLRSVLSRSS